MTLSDSHLQNIGRISANHSTSEFLVSLLIARIVKKDTTVGMILAAPMSMRQKLDVLGPLARRRITSETLKSRISNVVPKINEVDNERNRVLHSVWAFSDASAPVPARLKPSTRRDGFQVTEEILTADALAAIAEKFAPINKELAALVQVADPNLFEVTSIENAE